MSHASCAGILRKRWKSLRRILALCLQTSVNIMASHLSLHATIIAAVGIVQTTSSPAYAQENSRNTSDNVGEALRGDFAPVARARNDRAEKNVSVDHGRVVVDPSVGQATYERALEQPYQFGPSLTLWWAAQAHGGWAGNFHVAGLSMLVRKRPGSAEVTVNRPGEHALYLTGRVGVDAPEDNRLFDFNGTLVEPQTHARFYANDRECNSTPCYVSRNHGTVAVYGDVDSARLWAVEDGVSLVRGYALTKLCSAAGECYRIEWIKDTVTTSAASGSMGGQHDLMLYPRRVFLECPASEGFLPVSVPAAPTSDNTLCGSDHPALEFTYQQRGDAATLPYRTTRRLLRYTVYGLDGQTSREYSFRYADGITDPAQAGSDSRLMALVQEDPTSGEEWTHARFTYGDQPTSTSQFHARPQRAPSPALQDAPVEHYVLDIDGDGYDDMLAVATATDYASSQTHRAITVWHGGRNGLGSPTELHHGSETWPLHDNLSSSDGGRIDEKGWRGAVGDFDGDGRQELLRWAIGRFPRDDYAHFRLWSINDSGNFDENVYYPFVQGVNPIATWVNDLRTAGGGENIAPHRFRVEVGDFRGLGYDSVVVIHDLTHQSLYIDGAWISNGTANQPPPRIISPPTTASITKRFVTNTVVDDFDGDGRADLLFIEGTNDAAAFVRAVRLMGAEVVADLQLERVVTPSLASLGDAPFQLLTTVSPKRAFVLAYQGVNDTAIRNFRRKVAVFDREFSLISEDVDTAAGAFTTGGVPQWDAAGVHESSNRFSVVPSVTGSGIPTVLRCFQAADLGVQALHATGGLGAVTAAMQPLSATTVSSGGYRPKCAPAVRGRDVDVWFYRTDAGATEVKRLRVSRSGVAASAQPQVMAMPSGVPAAPTNASDMWFHARSQAMHTHGDFNGDTIADPVLTGYDGFSVWLSDADRADGTLRVGPDSLVSVSTGHGATTDIQHTTSARAGAIATGKICQTPAFDNIDQCARGNTKSRVVVSAVEQDDGFGLRERTAYFYRNFRVTMRKGELVDVGAERTRVANAMTNSDVYHEFSQLIPTHRRAHTVEQTVSSGLIRLETTNNNFQFYQRADGEWRALPKTTTTTEYENDVEVVRKTVAHLYDNPILERADTVVTCLGPECIADRSTFASNDLLGDHRKLTKRMSQVAVQTGAGWTYRNILSGERFEYHTGANPHAVRHRDTFECADAEVCDASELDGRWLRTMANAIYRGSHVVYAEDIRGSWQVRRRDATGSAVVQSIALIFASNDPNSPASLPITAVPLLATTTELNAAALPYRVTDANGNTTTTTYDYRGRPLTVTAPNGATVSYTYRHEGSDSQHVRVRSLVGGGPHAVHTGPGLSTGPTLTATLAAESSSGLSESIAIAVGEPSHLGYMNEFASAIPRAEPSKDAEATAGYRLLSDVVVQIILDNLVAADQYTCVDVFFTGSGVTHRTVSHDCQSEDVSYGAEAIAIDTKQCYAASSLWQLTSTPRPAHDPPSVWQARRFDAQRRVVGQSLRSEPPCAMTGNDIALNIGKLADLTRVAYSVDLSSGTGLRTVTKRINAAPIDENGAALTPPVWRTTTTTHDHSGRPEEVARGNTITNFAYDAAGRVTSTATGGGGTMITLDTGYDSAGRIRWADSSEGGRTEYDYFDDGLVRQVSFANGASHRYTYNSLGQKTAMWDADDSSIRYDFHYDGSALVNARGRLTRASGPWGDVEVTGYTWDGKIYERTTSFADGPANLVERLAYDYSGALVAHTFPDGTTEVIDRNHRGQVTSVGLRTAGGTWTLVEIDDYSAYGNAKRIHTSAATTQFSENALGSTTSIIATAGSHPLGPKPTLQCALGNCPFLSKQYTYGANGVLWTATDTRTSPTIAGIHTRANWTYDYDEHDRLIRALRNGADVLEFTYRDNHDIVCKRDTVRVYKGKEIIVRKRTKHDDKLCADDDSFKDESITELSKDTSIGLDKYVDEDLRSLYDKLSPIAHDARYVSHPKGSLPLQLAASGALARYLLDNAGLTVLKETAALTQFLSYDAWGNMTMSRRGIYGSKTSTYKPGAAVMTARFDGEGRRVVKTEGDITTYYLMGYEVREHSAAPNQYQVTKYIGDGHNALVQLTDGTLPSAHTLAGNLTNPSTAVTGSTEGGLPLGPVYIHSDRQGSASVLTDAYGNLITYANYLPYGEVDTQHSVGTFATPYTYTAQESDAATGFMHYDARTYDPMLGRMLQVDRVDGFPYVGAGLPRLAYALNNPIKYVDRDGHKPTTGRGVFLGGIQNTAPSGRLMNAVVGLYYDLVPGIGGPDQRMIKPFHSSRTTAADKDRVLFFSTYSTRGRRGARLVDRPSLRALREVSFAIAESNGFVTAHSGGGSALTAGARAIGETGLVPHSRTITADLREAVVSYEALQAAKKSLHRVGVNFFVTKQGVTEAGPSSVLTDIIEREVSNHGETPFRVYERITGATTHGGPGGVEYGSGVSRKKYSVDSTGKMWEVKRLRPGQRLPRWGQSTQ